MESADNRSKEPPSPDYPPPPIDESLLELVKRTMDLMRQAWVDRFKLAKAEARLAVKSALLIVVLTCAFCMVWVVAWIIVVVAIGYFALSQGLHWLAVTGILLLIQVAVGFFLTWQIRRLSRWLGFPATRESFSQPGPPLGDDEELNRAEG